MTKGDGDMEKDLNKKVHDESIDALTKLTEAYLKRIVANMLEMPEDRLDPHATMDKYGIDSIMIMDLNKALEKDFDSLPKTLFFEYSNIHELTWYFVENHRARLVELLNLHKVEPAEVVQEKPQIEERKRSKIRSRFKRTSKLEKDRSLEEESNDVAIIGLSGRYPKANDLESFWKNLAAGEDCITEIPQDRFDWNQYYDSDRTQKGKIYSKWGGFIEDVDKFDPRFFNISPREAELMDPQERLFLEEVWHTVEDAGYSSRSVSGKKVGVFVGVMYGEYISIGVEETLKGNTIGVGSTFAAIANRVSFAFNFCGPSMAIDTMCSSSLTALHLAYESIRRGDSELAIAGGVNISLRQHKYIVLSQSQFVSSDGRCRAFGDGGDGYVPGEGVGAVLLKPLQKAIEDGDHVYAVIKGTALNHGGKTNGFTVPNPNAQSQVIAEVLKRAKINPRSISYLEAHGTGTSLGDPIEVSGLMKVFRSYTEDTQYCAIGSVKSNIGHSESAAGIAALTKVLLMIQKRKLVPSIHSDVLNSNIDFNKTPFYVQRKFETWNRPILEENGLPKEYPLRAGISSFGAGGSNAHVLIEEYRTSGKVELSDLGEASTSSKQLVMLSAKNQERLVGYARKFSEYLSQSMEGVSHFPADKRSSVEENLNFQLKRVVGQNLNVDSSDLDCSESLRDYGVDEVKLSQVVDGINAQCKLNIHVSELNQDQSIDEISEYLITNYQEPLKKSFNDVSQDNSRYDDNALCDLADLAYTLQVGRDQFNERIAFVVDNLADLKKKLDLYVDGETNIEGVFIGSVKSDNRSMPDKVFGLEDISSLYRDNNWEAIARLWVGGQDIEWAEFFGRFLRKRNRISLPTYPFKKERCWIETTAGNCIEGKGYNPIHQMLDSNESTLDEQRYHKHLDGSEHYIQDHVVGGRRMLPGVAYLEMARAAGDSAVPELKVKAIKDTVWLQPVMPDGSGVEVYVSLEPRENHVAYAIHSRNDDGDQCTMNAQGTIVYEDELGPDGMRERLDLQVIRERCTNVLTKNECYRLFEQVHLCYGKDFQVLNELRSGDAEALAELVLPNDLQSEMSKYLLHPSLMDGALQSVMGLMKDAHSTYLPFSLGCVHIVGPLSPRCFSYVRQHLDSDQATLKFDIQIVDEFGTPLILMRDFVVRQYEATAIETHSKPSEMVCFTESWEQAELPENMEILTGGVMLVGADDEQYENIKRASVAEVLLTRINYSDQYRRLASNCYDVNPSTSSDWQLLWNDLEKEKMFPEHIVYYCSEDTFLQDDPQLEIDKSVNAIYHFVRTVILKQPKKHIHLLLLRTSDVENPMVSALSALFKTVHLENAKLGFRLLSISNKDWDARKRAELVLKECYNRTDRVEEVVYDNLCRRKRSLVPHSLSEEKKVSSDLKIKNEGVYIITGGMGGIGNICAAYLSKRYHAKLILSGRRSIDDSIREKLRVLDAFGGEARYISCDVANLDDVEKLLHVARDEFGSVDGVFHAAGILRDSILVKKEYAQFNSVLRPKILGAINLHKATVDVDIDFIVLFSSIAGVMGNVGQADYAYANRFLDEFSRWRNEQRRDARCFGKTIAIDWPLWEEGGMHVDAETKLWLRRSMGMDLLPTSDALEALEALIDSHYSNALLFYGIKEKAVKLLCSGLETETLSSSPEIGQDVDRSIMNEVRKDLVKIIGDILKVKEEDVDDDANMSEYGFDSVTITELTNKINIQFDLALTPAVFFEHESVGSILTYLCSEYASKLMEYYQPDGDVGVNARADTAEVSQQGVPGKIKRRFRDVAMSGVKKGGGDEPIAVVGMSGVFPQSNSLGELWSRLTRGEDLVSLIPNDRWSWENLQTEQQSGARASALKWGGFMREVDKFDAAFFNISPREAQLMDPQHRIMLEVVWKTIEDAGYSTAEISGTHTGLYIGVSSFDYNELLLRSGSDVEAYTSTGTVHSVLANRISYLLNLRGPSEPINTACSSSLIAIHHAVRSIRNGDCDMAIAGGVNVILTPTGHIAFGKAGMLSDDGSCKTFDKKANGYVRGEGAGALFLKPLSKARKDGDHIYGLIRATAENHGGHVSSLTVPNPVAQAELIVKAYERAEIAPWRVGYIECHGTGTSLGDPVEVNGLKKAFQELYRRYETEFKGEPYCGLGTIKTNIGHLEAAAGIAGAIKLLLSMQHKQLPGVVHFEELNPYIEVDGSPFYIVSNTVEWKRLKDASGLEMPLVAGVSSFGFGGANAHIVFEEYFDREKEEDLSQPSQQSEIIILSAKEEGLLREYVAELAAYLNSVENDVYPRTGAKRSSAELLDWLGANVSKKLGVAPSDIDVNESYGDYGVDELVYANLVEELKDQYDVEISSHQYCVDDNLNALTQLVVDQYPDIFSRDPSNDFEQNAIEVHKKEDGDITNLAYTLQVGRDAMDYRIAIVANSVGELKGKIAAYLSSGGAGPGIHIGNTKLIKDKEALLGQQDEDKHYIQELFEHRRYDHLAALWANGAVVDWRELHHNCGLQRKRLSLPTYPFKRDRYWVSNDAVTSNSVVSRKSDEQVERVCAKEWKETVAFGGGEAISSGKFLILCNEENVDFAENLFSEQKDVSKRIIQKRCEGAQAKDDMLVVDYANIDECKSVAESLYDDENPIQYVVDISDLRKDLRAHNDESWGKIVLLQHLLKNVGGSTLRLVHMTRHLQTFKSKECSLAGAMTAGYMSMLGAEYRRVVSRTIDVDTSSFETLSDIIIQELLIADDFGEVCYRSNTRYVPYLVDVRRDEAGEGLRINPNLVYVLTGGTRGVGSEIAKHLVENGARKLVLMGREDISDRNAWDEILSKSDANIGTVRKIRRIRELEDMGADVRLYCGELTNEDALKNFFEKIREEMGAIGGVLHCAGVVINDHPAFIHKSIGEMRRVSEPKVAALNVLHKLFYEDELEFFILFSSVSSIIPTLAAGVSDYASANAYMNFFAQYQYHNGRRYYKSIAWPNWKDVGMGKVDSPAYRASGICAHSTQDGLRILHMAMKNEGRAVLLPCIVDKAKFNPAILLHTKRSIVSDKKSDEHGVTGSTGSSSVSLLSWLRRLFSEELRMPYEQVATDVGFGEMGVDSILIAELVQRIEREFGEKVDPSLVLEYPTLVSLADYFAVNYAEAIKRVVPASGDSIESQYESVVGQKRQVASQSHDVQSYSNRIHVVEGGKRRPIAVVGMACHFPFAPDIDAYWRNLIEGRDCIVEVPPSRWDVESFYSPVHAPGKSISKWGGFLEGIEYFDPKYFGINEQDALHVDPLIRQIMEVSADLLRDAGYEKEEVSGKRIGVFLGSRVGNYSERIKDLHKTSITGIGQNFIAAHVAHYLNLLGPNLVIDTACSSSLVSIHLAVNSILCGESEMAIAGGVDILLDEKVYLILSEARALSPDGRCHTFDEKANGFVPGEGCGAVLLKDLDQALKDGNRIYGVIEASAVNNDGHTMGITTPNPEAQRAVIREALHVGQIDPATIGYIETHGTGTMIGDPIELKGLTKVFRETAELKGGCGVGSVKTNIGHALSAAGIASFIKVMLCIQRGQLVPTLHCKHPNPRFDFANSPFYPVQQSKKWQPETDILRAGMSSFGFGGTNAHIIVSEGDADRLKGYVAVRHKLDPIQFDRKKYWLESKDELESSMQNPVSDRKKLLEFSRVE